MAYKGSKHLEATQVYTLKLAACVIRMIPCVSQSKGKQQLPDVDAARPFADIFGQLEYKDLWSDARMVEVVAYLSGSKTLQIPAEWHNLCQPIYDGREDKLAEMTIPHVELWALFVVILTLDPRKWLSNTNNKPF